MANITVKIFRVPGMTKELGMAEGSTVADALQEAGTSVGEAEAITVNGANTTMDTVLLDGARVVIAKGAKGA